MCSEALENGECVRLVCFCVFHWACIDQMARRILENAPQTAPAGFTCPNCAEGLFPAANVVSPVADQLRETLKGVNWARAGLGLPLLEPSSEVKPEATPMGPRPAPEGISATPPSNVKHEVAIAFDTPTSRKTNAMNTAAFEHLKTSPLLQDPDENKYQRKSGLELLMRWLKATLGASASSRRRQSPAKRYLMMALLLFVGFVTFLALMSYLSKGSGDYSDPMLDPLNNPNIRVGSDR